MRTRQLYRNLAATSLLLALALLSGCVSAPRDASGPPPDWVRRAPPATGEFEYVVARGTDPGGDEDVALARATDALDRRLDEVLGADAPSPAGADDRPAGFRIVERHVQRDADGVTVSLLGEFERAALEAERTRRLELVAARRAAEADQVLRGAPDALGPSVREATVLAEGLRIRAVSGPWEAFVGEVPSRPVRFVVVDANDGPVPGLPVAITLHAGAGDSGAAADAASAPVRAVTGPDGGVEIVLPPVGRVGEVRVRARIDPDAALPAFHGATGPASEAGAVLVSALAAPEAVWRFQGFSRAPAIPTTVLVVETDAGGTPMPTRRASDGVEQALAESGFRLVANDARTLVGTTLESGDVVRALQNQLPAAAQRAVYGEARIVDFVVAEGVLVTVSATVMTVDLNTGRVIHSMTAVKNARSSSAEQALNTAFLQLGRSVGEELAATLP